MQFVKYDLWNLKSKMNKPADTNVYHIHIYPNPIYYSSRIEKIIKTVGRLDRYRNILFGIHRPYLLADEYTPEDVHIHRLKVFRGVKNNNAFIKVVQVIQIISIIFSFCLKRKIAIVDVHTLSMLPLGVLLKLIKGTVLIYNIHELETEKYGWSGFRKTAGKLCEKVLIGYADTVIVVNTKIADWYQQTYKIKPTVILNASYYMNYSENLGGLQTDFRFPPGTTVFVYVGSFSAGRSIEILLRVFSQIDTGEKVIIFIGYGSYQDKIITAQNKSRSIFYHPPLPAENIPQYIHSAHYGIALIENVCLSYYYSLPTKVFDYISAGIPTICSDLPEISNLVRRHHIGIIVSQLNTSGVMEVILNANQKDSWQYRENVRKIQSIYNWKNEEEKLKTIYRSIP